MSTLARSEVHRRTSRIPPLAAAAWAIALVVLVGLAVIVAHYLNGSGGSGIQGMQSMAGMSGMRMSSADALTRGGTRSPLVPLFGKALVTAWQLDAVAVAVLVVLAALYLTGVALVPVRSPGVRWPLSRTASFLAGLAVCAFATNGSIAVYDQVLFTAHMAGHLALIMVAPALLMFGRPLGLVVAASAEPRRARRSAVLRGRAVSLLTAPPVALATYAAVIVVSHLTGLMDTIMNNAWAGQVEHVVYLLVGCQFFVIVVGDEALRWRLGAPARVLFLFVAMAVDTFVGIILLQGTRAVALAPSSLHVNALSDTRTGGAIMWFGGDAIMALIIIVLAVAWLRNVETAPAEGGWLEQARASTFATHTGSQERTDNFLDEDDSAREAYNRWLARLDGR